MKKSIWILLLTALIGGTSFAQFPGADKKEKKSDLKAQVALDKKVTYGKLDNGFTYYIRNNKKPEKMIQFRLVTNAGSIMERDDQQGLAHFCEHMAFNGIKGYPGKARRGVRTRHQRLHLLRPDCLLCQHPRRRPRDGQDGYRNPRRLGRQHPLRPEGD